MPLPIFPSRLQCSSSSSSSSSRSSFFRPKLRIDPSLTLIPGLSNDVGRLILSFVPYPHISRIKSTCKSCFVKSVWERLSPMMSPRGSFACAAMPGSCGRIIVAGGGSRHTLFGAAGSRMSSVEMYDVEKDEWRVMNELPRFRAGCVGFLVENEKEKEKEEEGREFWVMGGYGGSRTVSGILPVDEYYKDAVVMDLRVDGGEKWRVVGDMWGEEERPKLGKIVAVDCGKPVFFMLDKDWILRYEMGLNRWRKESSVPKKAHYDKPVGFVALNGELHVMILLDGYNLMDTRHTRQQRKAGSLMIHMYDPKKKTWRSVVSKPPFNHQLDFRTTVMCTIRL